MKSLIITSILCILASCSTTKNVMKTAEGEQVERLNWNMVLETSEGKTEQKITGNVIKVSEDLYCMIEPEEKIASNKKYGGMRGKLANCNYLSEHFQLWTVCDKQMGVMDKVMVKNEKEIDMKLSLKCNLE